MPFIAQNTKPFSSQLIRVLFGFVDCLIVTNSDTYKNGEEQPVGDYQMPMPINRIP